MVSNSTSSYLKMVLTLISNPKILLPNQELIRPIILIMGIGNQSLSIIVEIMLIVEMHFIIEIQFIIKILFTKSIR